MERLLRHFGDDFSGLVVEADSLRHDLLQNKEMQVPDLERVANKISELVHHRFSPGPPSPSQHSPKPSRLGGVRGSTRHKKS